MQNCGACGTDNPAGHRFCGGCGQPLEAVCPSCGTAATPGFRFCGACGSALDGVAAAAPPAPLTERRVCSVLFADLVGFTPLSETRDHEDVRALLSRYFDTARTIVTRYGGTVEKFIGDAVMAVWGTPVASEGDAERAVRAGLDLVSAVTALGAELGADGLALRAGVVTGEVTATLGAVGEGMVAGDAVNTAARVQSAAEPGTVWVDGHTQRLAASAVGFGAVGDHLLKGKSESQPLWRATRVLSAVGGFQRVDGLEAPMIGRDAEERTLRELFHAAAERGTPRLLTITGPAGIGKSRLGWEFEKYVDGLASVVLWHRGRCLSYGDGVAFWALAEAFRQRFSIAAEDPRDEATVKLLDGLAGHVPAPEERAFVGVRVARLLGLKHPDDPGTPIEVADLFAGWRLLLERLGDEAPVVVLIEDAQHADDGLLDFVEHVVDRSRASAIFLVLLGRSEVLERRPSLGIGRNRTALPLDDLDAPSMQRLVSALVAGASSDDVDRIAGQAQGNPLFAVETVRSLIDRDVVQAVDGEYRLTGDLGALAVPDSLHGLLAARLDALEPELRALVADAAVLGTTFPGEALAAVSVADAADVTAGLDELVRRDVFTVSTDPLSPERGSYGFTQGMLRQVAYDTLSRRDRRERHLAVARHLQRTFADHGEGMLDVVAQHYLDALAPGSGEDDEAVRQAAVDCLVGAAERSESSGSNRRAAGSYERAAQLLADRDPLAAAALWERAATTFGAANNYDDAFRVLDEARARYDRAGRPREVARVDAAHGRWLRRTGRFTEALDLLSRAADVLRTDPDRDTVEALDMWGGTLALSGRPGAREVLDEALGTAQALDLPDEAFASLFADRALSALVTGRHREAAHDFGLAVQLAERAGRPREAFVALTNLSALQLTRDFAAAESAALRALGLIDLVGDPYNFAIASGNLTVARLQSGDWDGAAEALAAVRERGIDDELIGYLPTLLDALRGRPDPDFRPDLPEDSPESAPLVAWVTSAIRIAQGRPEEALQILSDLFGTEAEDVDHSLEPLFWSWPTAARLAHQLGRIEEERRLVGLLAVVPRGVLSTIARSNLDLARARLAAVDEQPDAAEKFEAAIASLRATGSPYHLAFGLLDHADFLEARGEDAAQERAEARVIGERLGSAEVLGRLRTVPA
ncbi:adenylate/guanylate cyclase domain-containing protein [Jatrophihabitans fulvus]